MNKKQIGIFLAVTVIVALAAVVAVNRQQSTVVSAQGGDYLFPGLEAKINDVAKIEVSQGGSHVTIERRDNNWLIVEKANYPADLSKIKEAVMKIAASTIVEAKTKIPENYAKLSVEDPATEDANSVQVSLKDGSGNDLASVIVGRMETGSFAVVGQDKTYVRKANDEQVWLVQGGIAVSHEPVDWMSEEIMNIDSSRVKKVEITRKDGKNVVVQKDKPQDSDFALANLPKGKEVRSPTGVTQVARSLETLRLLDVTKAEGFEFPEDQTIITELQTFDGIVITAKTVKQAGDYKTSFNARFDPTLRPVEEQGVMEVVNKEGEQPTAAAHPDPHAPKPAPLKEPELVQQEVTELNTRLSPWVFTLNRTKGKNLVEEMENLIKEKG